MGQTGWTALSNDLAKEYYSNPDVAALARLVVMNIPGAAHELLWEGCDGDQDIARGVIELVKKEKNI
jgi:hypothetical protein